jgi:hypothetical protein
MISTGGCAAMAMRNYTLRGIDPALDHEIRELARRRSTSINATILDLLRKALGLGGKRPPYSDLDRLAGGWTEEDLKEFRKSTAPFEQIERELWE